MFDLTKLIAIALLSLVAGIATFLFQLVVGLLVAGLAVLLPLAGMMYFADDYDFAHGRHGTMVVRSCTPDEGAWRCEGSFRSDDTEITIGHLLVDLDDKPGELVQGWVRDANEQHLKTSVHGWGHGWTVTFRWITYIVGGVGALIALIRAAIFGFAAGAWAWDELDFSWR